MNDNMSRYGRQGPSVSAVVLAALMSIVMIVAGALWTFQPGSGSKNSFLETIGPILAGLGVALAYVTVRSVLRSRR